MMALLHRWRATLGVRLGAAVVLTALLMIAFAANQISALNGWAATGELVRTNVWMAAQIETEYYRFVDSLRTFQDEPTGAARADVAERYQIFWSRLSPAMVGPEGMFLRTRPGAVELLADVDALLAEMEPLLLGPTPLDSRAVDHVMRDVKAFQQPLRDLAVEAMTGEGPRELRERVFEARKQAAAYAQLFAFALFCLMVILIVEIYRNHRRAAAEREARAQVESVSAAKSRFLATMSHELRTPLNAIIGFSSIIKDELFGPNRVPQYKEYAADVHLSAEHLLSIVDDVLEMARIDAGQQQMKTSTFDFVALMASAMIIIGPKLEARNIRPVWLGELADGRPYRIAADKQLVLRVMLNLLSNVAKFVLPDSTVCIGLEERGEKIVVSVSDGGPGMPSDLVNCVCEPFVQGNSGLAREAEGTGLGLSLARAHTRLHGGELFISSSPGTGTCIRLVFPKARLRPLSVLRRREMPAPDQSRHSAVTGRVSNA